MGKKQTRLAFVTSLGRHTPKSIGQDLNIHDFVRKVNDTTSKVNKSKYHFGNAHKVLSNLETITRAIKIGKDIYTGLSDNGHNPIINGALSKVPMLTQTSVSALGKNGAKYNKIHTHIGYRTSSIITKLAESPNVVKVTKQTADSASDYQSTAKRNQLKITNGFNEKCFVFFMEDTYFSVDDLYRMYNVEKRFKRRIKSDTDGLTEIHGCMCNTHHKIKMRNRIDSYSVHVQIHLIKIMNKEMDVRNLLDEITHKGKTSSKELSGKLPVDFQYTEPQTKEITNKCQLNFKTNLSANLNQSTRFGENAKILESWARSIEPGSILEFHLTHHYGKGVPINRLLDEHESHEKRVRISRGIADSIKFEDFSFEIKNVTESVDVANKAREYIEKIQEEQKGIKKEINEHPVGYVIGLEIVGDRRASMQRKKDQSIFEGYSPSHLGIELETHMTFLSEDSDEGLTKPLVYKREKQNRDFDDSNSGQAEMKELFCPDRAERIHQEFDKIEMNNGLNKDGPYKLIYDQILTGETTGILDDMKDIMKNLGLDTDNLTPDDLKLKFDTPPSEEEKEESEEN